MESLKGAEISAVGSPMLTINPMLRKEAVERRAYQLEIAREAVKKNTLVVLPTALGKTVIAALTASISCIIIAT